MKAKAKAEKDAKQAKAEFTEAKAEKDEKDDKKDEEENKDDKNEENDDKDEKKDKKEEKEDKKDIKHPFHFEAPKPAQAPKPARSNIHITFRPGSEEPNLSLLDESASVSMLNKPQPSLVQAQMGKSHWSVMVDVTITEGLDNGATDLEQSQKYVRTALLSGQLKESLRGAIYEVTGDAPDVRNLDVTKAKITQWNIDKCEKHFTKMVNTFTLHYTRAQVPAALYNECTNFMPKMSFSRDHILDSGDAARCRKATRAFQKHWKYGKNSKPKDFQQICLETCEAKFGKLAPRCHVPKA